MADSSALALTLQTHNHHITLKLNSDNYNLWKFLVKNFLEGHNLFGYVDGSNPPPPPKQVLTATSATVDNPEYQSWYHQDKQVLSIIVSTLTEEILPHVLTLSSSREVWLTLETLFSAHSQAHIMQIRSQLTNLKKGSQKIAKYFRKAQNLAHALVAANQPIQDSKLVSHILVGLGTDYDSLVTSVTTRPDSIKLDDLYRYLLSHEIRLDQQQTAIDISIPTANTAQRQPFSYPR
jgi:hypothetical protein